MDKPKSVSSRDVAREAGVSQATVSYVLNDVSGIKIKPCTREAVLAAAKKLNYHPDLIARSMKLKKSMSIGVVTDKNLSNYLFMKVLEGMKDIFTKSNYSITLCLNKSVDINDEEYIRYYRSKRIDGVIFAFSHLSDEDISYLMENNIPFVIIHTMVKNEMIHTVRTDMNTAMKKAVELLYSKGIKQFAYMTDGVLNEKNRRYNTFLAVLKNIAGLQYDLDTAQTPKVIEIPQDGVERKLYMEKLILDRQSLPGAVICESNSLSFFLLKTCAEYSVRIPLDMAVIGVGTSRYSDNSYPSLSTIEAPLYDMGITGAKMLLALINNSPVEENVTLEWDFVTRDSC
jgi:DNA-binding LacI/PurR family transcriptional regulator